jgi:transcriptional regulator with XRE-family HTH domain
VAVVTATDRTREQGKRLRELRERLDLSKGVLIDALAFGSTQTYDLYERGVSVIRLDRVPEWAAAFGISQQAFLNAVLEPDGEYTVEQFREHIVAAGLPQDIVSELVAIAAEQPALGRRSLAEGYVRLWQRRRTRNAHEGDESGASGAAMRLLTG